MSAKIDTVADHGSVVVDDGREGAYAAPQTEKGTVTGGASPAESSKEFPVGHHRYSARSGRNIKAFVASTAERSS